MKKRFITLSVFIICSLSQAQVDISKVGIDLGLTKNHQADIGHPPLFAISPELSIGGNFLVPSLEWSANISYWDDGIDEPLRIMDGVTYSHSSFNASVRMYFLPSPTKLSAHLISGLSTQFISGKYIGGYFPDGSFRRGSNYILFTADLGLGLDYKLNDRVRLRLDGLVYIALKEEEYLFTKGNTFSLKVGVDYFINM